MTLAPPLVRRAVYCYHPGCGVGLPKKALFEIAGEGEVVLFKICPRCGTMNIIDARPKPC